MISHYATVSSFVLRVVIRIVISPLEVRDWIISSLEVRDCIISLTKAQENQNSNLIGGDGVTEY